MMQNYCGNWHDCDDDIDALIAIGVEVKWTKCWKYDFGKDAEKYDDRKWNVLNSEQELLDATDDHRNVKENWWGYPQWVNLESYCVISYRVDAEKYPLLNARYKQYIRDENERLHAQMEKEYEEWCEERQRQIDAYLEKYPERGEPEYYQEGIHWFRVNDPDKGEIIVNVGREV